MTKCPFSKYRDIFGQPNTGVHALKFKGTSLVDYSLSIALAFLITALDEMASSIDNNWRSYYWNYFTHTIRC